MSSMEFSLSMKGSLKPYNLIPKALKQLTTSILMNQLSKLCVFRITSIISNHTRREKVCFGPSGEMNKNEQQPIVKNRSIW